MRSILGRQRFTFLPPGACLLSATEVGLLLPPRKLDRHAQRNTLHQLYRAIASSSSAASCRMWATRGSTSRRNLAAAAVSAIASVAVAALAAALTVAAAWRALSAFCGHR